MFYGLLPATEIVALDERPGEGGDGGERGLGGRGHGYRLQGGNTPSSEVAGYTGRPLAGPQEGGRRQGREEGAAPVRPIWVRVKKVECHFERDEETGPGQGGGRVGSEI